MKDCKIGLDFGWCISLRAYAISLVKEIKHISALACSVTATTGNAT